jgi:hypothetical protein
MHGDDHQPTNPQRLALPDSPESQPLPKEESE